MSRFETGFLNRTVAVNGEVFRYVVYRPWEWTPELSWPVILFLHGSGERGEDGLAQTQVGLPRALRVHCDRYPAVVVMPQCRHRRWWTDPQMQDVALSCLDQSLAEQGGDPARVTLTGLSMGGYGLWSLVERCPHRFAALAPICGGIHLPPPLRQEGYVVRDEAYRQAALACGQTPVWVFHGGSDDVVPPEESRRMVDELRQAGNPARYTEYHGIGHISWDLAYGDPEFSHWLLSQRR